MVVGGCWSEKSGEQGRVVRKVASIVLGNHPSASAKRDQNARKGRVRAETRLGHLELQVADAACFHLCPSLSLSLIPLEQSRSSPPSRFYSAPTHAVTAPRPYVARQPATCLRSGGPLCSFARGARTLTPPITGNEGGVDYHLAGGDWLRTDVAQAVYELEQFLARTATLSEDTAWSCESTRALLQLEGADHSSLSLSFFAAHPGPDSESQREQCPLQFIAVVVRGALRQQCLTPSTPLADTLTAPTTSVYPGRSEPTRPPNCTSTTTQVCLGGWLTSLFAPSQDPIGSTCAYESGVRRRNVNICCISTSCLLSCLNLRRFSVTRIRRSGGTLTCANEARPLRSRRFSSGSDAWKQ